MEQIYKQYYSRLFSFINSKVHNREDAISELSNCIEPIINSLAPKYAQALYLSEIKEKLHQCCSYKYDNFENIIEFDIKNKNCNFC
ncbi:MAG: hypothetical protein C0627_08595 [Sulfurimonas sp.]|nr:MAG: hypothetical protein C0627_08595 [Sulfurimonas sp.]